MRIYLDGSPEPVVDLPFRSYFDGSSEPFVYPSLVHMTGSGYNCYVPIPYQKSCKIVASPDWGRYYHFTHSTFPKGTVVPTFTRELFPRDRLALRKADMMLSDRLGERQQGQSERRLPVSVRIGPGQKLRVARIEGPNAITSIRIRPDRQSRGEENLRSTALMIRWDGEMSPSVWAPIGDFFGTGPGYNEYKSYPMGVTPDGLYSFWYMPFANEATMDLINDGSKDFSADIEITYAPLSLPADQQGRFHAKWHRDAFLPQEPERVVDWTMLKTEGSGRFCGVALEVWNPRGGWWGEGDEKFFVDGEKFPSTFGTGSEDYFGYAWCKPELFQNAFHNQTRNDWDNARHVSVNRWHIADSVPFVKSFEGCIEKYQANDRPTRYACTTFWYLGPGEEDLYEITPVGMRSDWYPEAEIVKLPGVLEGEDLKIIEITKGQIKRQATMNKWSGNMQASWLDGQGPGDKVTFGLPVGETGDYTVQLRLLRGRNCGTFQFYLDKEKLGGPMDLYDSSGKTLRELETVGTSHLSAGNHTLTAEVVGINEKATPPDYWLGLDCVKLDPIR